MTFDQPSTLMEKTISLLKADPRSLPELYKESGIPFYWLRTFAEGGFKNPSVNRVQYLYEFLTGSKLEVK